MDRRVWWPTVHGVTTSRTQLKQLSTHTHTVERWHKSNVISAQHMVSNQQMPAARMKAPGFMDGKGRWIKQLAVLTL